ncbi:MAG: FecCD family ABC transporter permease [Candidatus Bathyarchaeia archaeon]
MSDYEKYSKRRTLLGLSLLVFLILFALYSLFTGSYNLSLAELLQGLIRGDKTVNLILWNIRLPRIISAIIAGLSLALAGAVMQSILRNPLASPYTLGISQGAAFGASFAIIVLGVGVLHRTGEGVTIINPYVVPFFAFAGSLIGVTVVMLLAKLRGLSPEAMILAGVAMGSLFQAATMLIQYFAENEILVASVVFWTFGDLGRSVWREIGIMSVLAIVSLIYFLYRRWDFNALMEGDDVALSLGVDPKRVRIEGMILSSLLTAVCVSFLGIIGFIGLVAPHLIRLLIASDYRYLIPVSALTGSTLLLVSDTVGRTIISPVMIPVGIVTSFIGAPTFIYLLMRKRI